MKALERPSITVATPPMPAIKTAFHNETPAIAPAPTTLNPEAANTATMRNMMFLKLLTFFPHFLP